MLPIALALLSQLAFVADPAPTPTPIPTPTPTLTPAPTSGPAAPESPAAMPTTEIVPGGKVKVLPNEPILGFADADALLTALETADANLSLLTAQIRYTRDFAIAGDTQIRKGSLWFVDSSRKGEQARQRSFAIRFDSLIVGQREEKREQFYTFDGEWLVEKFPGEKRMIKRQVVRPGEKFDPLKIGEGPLPIPIGQKRADILARYDATLLPADDGFDEMPLERAKRLTEFTQGCVQLLLEPRAEVGGRDPFKAIRLWYKPAESKGSMRLLPRLAHTINTADDESTVELIGIRINEDAKLDSGVFDTSTPKDWDVIIQPFRGAIEGDDAPTAPAARTPSAPSPGPNIQPAGTDRQNPSPNPASNSGSNPADKPK
mgnify:CR=1 FL=1